MSEKNLNTLNDILDIDGDTSGAQRKFPYMPLGQAVDMGFTEDGIKIYIKLIFSFNLTTT